VRPLMRGTHIRLNVHEIDDSLKRVMIKNRRCTLPRN